MIRIKSVNITGKIKLGLIVTDGYIMTRHSYAASIQASSA